jgi:hypothetical protein
MQTKLIIIAVASALAAPAIAAPYDAPYMLKAVHADFEAQLEEAAAAPGTIGTAARLAADLMAVQNAAQERLVLPLLGWADATAAGKVAPVADLPSRMNLEAELLHLYDADVDLVTALVELYAAAEEAGQPGIARIAERIIWHQISDVDVLYPAALLVASIQAPAFAEPMHFSATAEPLYGSGQLPMMGVGNPHPHLKGN